MAHGGEAIRCVEVDLLHPHRKWAGWNVVDIIWLCCTIGIVCGLPVVSQIFWRMDLEKQEGAVVGVFWPLPFGPPLSILNAH